MSHTAQKINTLSQWISLLPEAGKHYHLHLIDRQLKHRCDMKYIGLEKGVFRGKDTG